LIVRKYFGLPLGEEIRELSASTKDKILPTWHGTNASRTCWNKPLSSRCVVGCHVQLLFDNLKTAATAIHWKACPGFRSVEEPTLDRADLNFYHQIDPSVNLSFTSKLVERCVATCFVNRTTCLYCSQSAYPRHYSILVLIVTNVFVQAVDRGQHMSLVVSWPQLCVLSLSICTRRSESTHQRRAGFSHTCHWPYVRVDVHSWYRSIFSGRTALNALCLKGLLGVPV